MAMVDINTIAAYLGGPVVQANWLAPNKDQQSPGAVLHSSDEPGELL